MSNRRWSANAVSAEPAGNAHNAPPPALQGLNSHIQPLQGWGSVGFAFRRFRSLRSLHRRLLT